MSKATLRLLVVLGVAIAGLIGMTGSAAADGLEVTPLTWDLIGLDSNKVRSGPDTFPVGVRVCNTSGSAVTGVSAELDWTGHERDDTDSRLIALQTDEDLPASRTIGDLANGACGDAYWYATIERNANAFYNVRPARDAAKKTYTVSAADSGSTTTGTATGTLYVEKIISQNRNKIVSIVGPSTLAPGAEATYILTAYTASSFSEVEAFLVFPKDVRVVSSPATFSRTDFGGLASTLGPWADGCNKWSYTYSPIPGNANCPGPGKQGNTVVVTYTVIAAPGTLPFTLKGLIYDFSGSAFHYNKDFGVKTKSVTIGYPLNVTVTGDGDVTDGEDPANISCGTNGAKCNKAYAPDDPPTSVVLTATPGPDQEFRGWDGDCEEAGIDLTCTVTMNEARNVTADFTGDDSVPLNTETVGSGGITSNDGQINCVDNTLSCDKSYKRGNNVRLTAAPITLDGVEYVFIEWSDACAGQDSTCDVPMTRAKTVVATFVPGWTLTVNPVPTGGGVTDANGLVNCSSTTTKCLQGYADGDEAVVTATPTSGYRFVAWKGACASETSTTCTLEMTENRVISAEFESTGTTTSTRETAPKLKLTVTSSRIRTRSGQTVKVKLVLRNTGTATATKPRTCLTIPAGFTVVTPIAKYAGGRVCFSNKALEANKSKTYLVTLRATKSGTKQVPFRGVTRASNAKSVADTANTRLVPIRQNVEMVTG